MSELNQPSDKPAALGQPSLSRGANFASAPSVDPPASTVSAAHDGARQWSPASLGVDESSPPHDFTNPGGGGTWWKILLGLLLGGLLTLSGVTAGWLFQSQESDVSQSSQSKEDDPGQSQQDLAGKTLSTVSGNSAEPAKEVADAVGPAVVQIEVATNNGMGVGSGVVYEKNLIITNHHVVQNASAIRVRLDDGRTIEATLRGASNRIDIAVIEVDEDLPIAKFGDSSKVEVGQTAIALGSPLHLRKTVTQGIVSAVNRPLVGFDRLSYVPAIQTDAPINHGNSGGPLVDRHGLVIGINTQLLGIGEDEGSVGSIGLGFAIPSNVAARVAEKLISGSEIKPGFLGVSGGEATDGATGVVIDAITPRSAAASSDLEVGDRIISIDDIPVYNIAELAGLVNVAEAGDEVELEVMRGSDSRTLQVTLGERS